jgi:hypothetical protein
VQEMGVLCSGGDGSDVSGIYLVQLTSLCVFSLTFHYMDRLSGSAPAMLFDIMDNF